MPIYEYRCPDCGNEQENLIRSDSNTPVCKSCGGGRLNRKLSVFAVSSVSSSMPEDGCGCAGGGGCADQAVGGCSHPGGCGCAG